MHNSMKVMIALFVNNFNGMECKMENFCRRNVTGRKQKLGVMIKMSMEVYILVD